MSKKTEAKCLQFTQTIAPDLRALALIGDPLRLQQILLNFVGNAIRFTEQGNIKIAASIKESCPEHTQSRLRCRTAARI